MSQLFTDNDFMLAKEFAKIECSAETEKTVKNNIEKTLVLVSKLIKTKEEPLTHSLDNSLFFNDLIEKIKILEGSSEQVDEGFTQVEQGKLKIKASYL